MTKEEKAVAYDAAIKKVKELAIDDYLDAIAVTDIFPELKEIEDEKIINLIKKAVKEYWSDEPLDEILAWLEKQGEQKPQGKSALEAAKEEKVDNQNCVKPAKVEPKFKVGDWVIDVQGVSSNQIIGYEDDSYYIETSCSKFYLPMKLAEKNYRLWIIQDAKDGDVLTTDTWTFIFKKYQDISVYYHCAASAFNDFSISDTGEFDSSYVHPATKEQRYILFQKMKEAGYEWDADKKELKKIEQKPAWSEEDEAIYYGVIETEQYMLDVVNGIKKFNVGNISIKEECTRELNWLKSLKDRVQPKQEWGEEDESNLQGIIDEIKANKNHAPAYDLATYNRFLSWLKSLRPQKQWKPSDEQMVALEHAINCYSGISPTNTEEVYTLEIMKEQLKKLTK